MTRGGARPGSGQRPRAGEPMTEIIRVSVTPSQLWWAEHVAEHVGLPLTEWIRSLIDQAVGEHTCAECSGGST